MSLEVFLRSCAFTGMVIVDVVVAVGYLFPVSLVELATNTNLGTYDTAKQMHEFTVQVGTGD